MSANAIYQPSRSLGARIGRRLTPFQARRLQTVRLERPLVSFSFDDCPKSVLDTALPSLEANGWPATIYLACGLFGITNHLGLHMSAEDAQAVARNGHEIGDHTFSHFDATSCPQTDFISDITRNQAMFDSLDLPQATTFAYPYGQTYAALKNDLGSRFKGLRGITPLSHHRNVDLNQIGSYPLFSGPDVTKLLNAIENLKDKPAWLTIFTHDVQDTPSPWGCTQTDLDRIITALKAVNADVRTVSDAIDHLESRYG